MSRCMCAGSSSSGSVAKRSGDIVLLVGGPFETFETGELLDFFVPPSLNGMHITAINSAVTGLTGSTENELGVYRLRGGPPTDILSTPSTIDAGERNSFTAAVPSVVNVANQTILTGDILRVHVDTVGTDAAGLQVIISYLEP